jgi:photosystem II stability/assembly factor-like uncharacterized protein
MLRLLAAVALLLIPISQQPAPVHAMRAPLSLTGVEMIGARIGWGVSNRLVFRTVDGGQNWTEVMPCGIPVQHQLGVYFLSGTDAWIAVSPAAVPKTNAIHRGPVTVFRTTNGGQTWQRLLVPIQGSVEPFSDLTFANRHDGWFWLDDGTMSVPSFVLLHTLDGGQHWMSVADVGPRHRSVAMFPSCNCGRAITFRDDTTGWVTGSNLAPSATSGPFLWVTRDSGRRWQHQSLPLPNGYHFSQTYPPHFFGLGEGILPVQLVRGKSADVFDAYLTHNGGMTWTSTTPLVLPELAQVGSVPTFSFSDRLHGWVSNGSDLYHTADGGRHWIRLQPHGLHNLIAQLDFADRNRGIAQVRFILGRSPAYLLHTSDGGRTWRVVSTYSASLPLHRCT